MKFKGMYGYIDQKKKLTVVKIAINLVFVIGIYGVGLYLTKTRATYFTLVAVLLAIPLAYFCTGLISLWPWKSIESRQKEEFLTAVGEEAVIAFDLVLTVKEKQQYAGAVLFSGREVVLYTAGKSDLRKRRNDLSTMLRETGYFSGVYLTDNWDNFLSRVKADVKADKQSSVNKDELCKQKERLLIYSI